MGQNAIDRLLRCYHSDNFHAALTLRALENVEIKASFQEFCPRNVGRRRPPIRFSCGRGYSKQRQVLGRLLGLTDEPTCSYRQ